MIDNIVKIATRGSKLALYQANKVKETLQNKFPDKTFEIEIIKTKGDKILDVALSKIGDKGLFTKELENSLLNNEADLAVHSLKDLPTQLPAGLILGGVLERAEVRDALVTLNGKTLAQLDETDVVATSSLRRKAQLLSINPAMKIVDIRGNVDSRIQKMKDGYCTAMLMAAAGLLRLGLGEYITEVISEEKMLPAVSQGAIAIEIRENDIATQELIHAITHFPTLTAVKAERIFLNALEGGCQIPIGCFSEINDDKYSIKGFVSHLDGSLMLKASVTGNLKDADALAQELANYFIKKGAAEIINNIRSINNI